MILVAAFIRTARLNNNKWIFSLFFVAVTQIELPHIRSQFEPFFLCSVARSFVVGLEFIAYETIWNPILISFCRISTNVCANASDQMPAHKLFIGFFSVRRSQFHSVVAVSESFAAFACVIHPECRWKARRRMKWKTRSYKSKESGNSAFFHLSLYLPCGFWRWCGALEQIFILLIKPAHSNACADETTTRRWTCVGEWA